MADQLRAGDVRVGYRPSNGTEGGLFREQTCYRCVKDHQWHDGDDGTESCPIILSSMAGEYAYPNEDGPPQWSHDYGTGESWCSEFEGPCPCEIEGGGPHEINLSATALSADATTPTTGDAP